MTNCGGTCLRENVGRDICQIDQTHVDVTQTRVVTSKEAKRRPGLRSLAFLYNSVLFFVPPWLHAVLQHLKEEGCYCQGQASRASHPFNASNPQRPNNQGGSGGKEYPGRQLKENIGDMPGALCCARGEQWQRWRRWLQEKNLAKRGATCCEMCAFP